jgi:nucleolar pre-ribosomal-associated protein 1
LILKSGLISWIEIQLITTRQVTDGVAWVKILDNLMTVVDPDKIEVSTNGEWRSVICRCLSMLLDEDKTRTPASFDFVVFLLIVPAVLVNTTGILPFAAAAILRLSLLAGPTVLGLVSLLNRAVQCLKRMETNVTIPSSSTRLSSATLISSEPLFRACEIHEPYSERELLRTWGQCVEVLWRATMTMENKPPVWDVLSSRLLLWRAIADGNSSPIGEWARIQVVCNLSTNE